MSEIIDLDQIADAPLKVRLKGTVIEVRTPGLVELAEMLEFFNKIQGDQDLSAMKKAVNIILDWVENEEHQKLFRGLTIPQFQKLVEGLVKQMSGDEELPKELTPITDERGAEKAKKKSD